MAKYSVKKDDNVMIIAGKDKGKTAQIIAVNRDNHRVLLDGKDLASNVTKAVKARKASDKGGLIEQPGSVDISNVMPICSACNKPTRVGHKIVDGKSVRVCQECSAVLVTKKPVAKKATEKVKEVASNVATKAKAAVRRKAKPEAEENN